MPDLFTIFAITGLSWATSGLIGNVADRTICHLVRSVLDRVRSLRGSPEHDTVAGSVRRAQLMALERAARDFRAKHAGHDRFVKRALGYCKSELAALDKGEAELQLAATARSVRLIDGLLASPPGASDPVERRDSIAAEALNALSQEVHLAVASAKKVPEVPVAFTRHLRHGSDQHGSYLDLFGAYVCKELAKNDSFRRILSQVRLAEITTGVGNLRDWNATYGSVLEDIRETTRQVYRMQEDHGAILREQTELTKLIADAIVPRQAQGRGREDDWSVSRLIEKAPRESHTRVYGRREELDQILILLERYSVAITGIQGIGKSTLCAMVFDHLLRRPQRESPFRRFYWTRFTADDAPPFSRFARTLVLALTGRDLGVDTLEQDEQVQMVLHALRESHCLLAIDQFEAVVEAGTRRPSDRGYAELLKYVREGVGFARLLITAWETPLDQGGVEFPSLAIGGIADDACWELIQGESGRGSGGGLDETLGRRLTHQFQGHPLALKLLAGKYGPEALTDLLDDPELLSASTSDIAPLVVERIYRRVAQDASRLRSLQAVAVLTNGCTDGAVGACADLDRATTFESLAELSHRNLVSRDGKDLRVGKGTYTMHALVRSYVAGQIEPTARWHLHERAAKYFRSLPCPPLEDRESRDDVASLLDAVDHLISAHSADEAAELFLTEQLDDQLYRWAHWRELVKLYQQLIEDVTEDSIRISLLGKLGMVHRDLQERDLARRSYERALALARRCKDVVGECTQLTNLGDLAHYDGDSKKAVNLHQAAQLLLDGVPYPALEARNQGCWGNALLALGDVEGAEDRYVRAIRMCRQTGDRRYEGIWTGDLGNVYARRGQREQAIARYEAAFRIADRLKDRSNASLWLYLLARQYADTGEPERAVMHVQRALEIAVEILDRRRIGDQLSLLLRICNQQENLPEAIGIINRLSSLDGDRGRHDSEIGWVKWYLEAALFAAAAEFDKKHDFRAAETAYDDALRVAPKSARALSRRGRCRRMQAFDSLDAARLLVLAAEDYAAALALDPDNDGYCMLLAACSAQRGDLENAIPVYARALELNPANIQATLGKMEAEICLGRYSDAVRTHAAIDRRLMTPAEELVAAALMGVASAFEGEPTASYEEILLRGDHRLSRYHDWALIEVTRHLAELSTVTPPPAGLDGALRAWDLFVARFKD